MFKFRMSSSSACELDSSTAAAAAAADDELAPPTCVMFVDLRNLYWRRRRRFDAVSKSSCESRLTFAREEAEEEES